MNKLLAVTAVLFLFLIQNISAQGWQWVDTGYPYYIYDISFPPGQNDIGFAVGSNLAFGGDGIILKTIDGGSSWTKISVDTIPGLKAVCFTSIDAGYAGGFNNFLMKTTDGGSNWESKVIDTKLWYFNNIEFWDSNNGIAVSAPSALYVTADAGNTWSPAFGIKHTIEDVCYADANTVFIVGGNETISKSDNGGLYFLDIYTGTILSSFFGIEFYNINYGIVSGENGKVLVTTDGGINWITGSAGSGMLKGIDIFNQQNAFVVGAPEQVYKTTDGGISWTSDFIGGSSIEFYKIKFTENHTGLICGSEGKFLRNTDYVVPVELTAFYAIVEGNDVHLNWTTETEINNSGFEIHRLTHGSGWQNLYFISGYGTSSETNSYSSTDRDLKSGYYFYRLKQIDFDASYEYSEIINILVSNPEAFILDQNYPNPFNSSTLIKFSLPEDVNNVRLSIYNIEGQKVAELVNAQLVAGRYSYQWDAGNIASGTYFYELKTDKFISKKKMILLK